MTRPILSSRYAWATFSALCSSVQDPARGTFNPGGKYEQEYSKPADTPYFKIVEREAVFQLPRLSNLLPAWMRAPTYESCADVFADLRAELSLPGQGWGLVKGGRRKSERLPRVA